MQFVKKILLQFAIQINDLKTVKNKIHFETIVVFGRSIEYSFVIWNFEPVLCFKCHEKFEIIKTRSDYNTLKISKFAYSQKKVSRLAYMRNRA